MQSTEAPSLGSRAPVHLSKQNFIALKQKKSNDEINNFLMLSYCKLLHEDWELRETNGESLNEMEEFKKF